MLAYIEFLLSSNTRKQNASLATLSVDKRFLQILALFGASLSNSVHIGSSFRPSLLINDLKKNSTLEIISK